LDASSTSLKLHCCSDVTRNQFGVCSDFSESTVVLM
jgi:hypothetical protein